ncbi:hypothetical protein FB639_003880 [Coemansia asiatica]|nr:hypothetical protein FB639_003880 [Coemansia asiatica]
MTCFCPATLRSIFQAFPPSTPFQGTESPQIRVFFWSTALASFLLTFVNQRGRRNYSIVDRIWPLYPLCFLVQWQMQATRTSPQSVVIQSLVYLWGMRLCFNSLRRGDYRVGAEDYRWKHVQMWFSQIFGNGLTGSLAWEAFNLGFIAVFQLALLYLIALPVRLVILQSSEGQWDLLLVSLAVAMLLTLAGEALADQQQYAYQQHKRVHPDRIGFVHQGLWRFSRHPNVFCEGLFWVLVSIFCMCAGGVDAGVCENAWYWAGPLCLLVLLSSSVRLTESISLGKYPAYKAYVVKTSRILPMVPRDNREVIDIAHSYHFVH